MSSGRDPSRRSRDREERPDYTLYKSRPRFLGRFGDGGGKKVESLDSLRGKGPSGGGRRITWKRVVLIGALVLAGWLGLSLLLFLVSAQIQRGKVSDAAKRELSSGGNIVFSANTVLVLGSDARPKGTHEGGANTVGQPSRSDTIMLLRVGAGKSARLSIPRDTVVNIPGSGLNKINAAYAIGGPQLTLKTVKQYLGIDINHLIEVDFDNFPKFVNALGGIDFTAKRCIRAKVDGGAANGGVTIRIKRGQTVHLNGKKTLALSRIRVNDCNPAENDINRAERQQQVLSAIKSQLLSPTTFFRLPWVSWTAPKAIRTDMGGPTLMGLFMDIGLTGSPTPKVLKPSGFVTLPDGGQGLTVTESEKQSEVKRFLRG